MRGVLSIVFPLSFESLLKTRVIFDFSRPISKSFQTPMTGLVFFWGGGISVCDSPTLLLKRKQILSVWGRLSEVNLADDLERTISMSSSVAEAPLQTKSGAKARRWLRPGAFFFWFGGKNGVVGVFCFGDFCIFLCWDGGCLSFFPVI